MVTVTVSGEKWTQVRNVYYSPDTERIFSVHKEEDGIYIYLHKTWEEWVDSFDPTFTIRFVKSLYNFTTYTEECLSITFAEPLLDTEGFDVSEYYRIIPLLGTDAQSVASLMPSTTEGNRAITVLDYEQCASLFPGLASCRAYDWNTFSVVKNPFEVMLIACDGEGKLSSHMKQVLLEYLESIGSPLITVKIQEPIFVEQDILVLLDIGDYKETLAETQIKLAVNTAIKDFYKIGNLQPGRVVKTTELNSLCMHTDSRIYFATCSFLNSVPKSPYIIPVLGNVVIITSAWAFTREDVGFADDVAKYGPFVLDYASSMDHLGNLGIYVHFGVSAHIIAPVDKFPAQAFDAVSYEDVIDHTILGQEHGVITNDNFHTKVSGGDPSIGKVLNFAYETDGSGVIEVYNYTYHNVYDAAIEFTNSFGQVTVQLDFSQYQPETLDVDVLRGVIAKALNETPGLVGADYRPLQLTASDIVYTGESDATPLQAPKVSKSTSKPLGAGDAELIDVSDEGHATEKTFIYIPFNIMFSTDHGTFSEAYTLRKTDFTSHVSEYIDNHYFRSFTYSGSGRYIPTSGAYGDLAFSSDVTVLYTTQVTSYYKPDGKPGILTGSFTPTSKFRLRSMHSQPLTWYLCKTDFIGSVQETLLIGRGIFLEFELQQDVGIYFIADEATGRGMVYTAQFDLDEFEVLDL